MEEPSDAAGESKNAKRTKEAEEDTLEGATPKRRKADFSIKNTDRNIKKAKKAEKWKKDKSRGGCYMAVQLSNRSFMNELATISTTKEQKLDDLFAIYKNRLDQLQ